MTRTKAIATVAVAGLLVTATYVRTLDFVDSPSLWMHDAEVYPHAARPLFNACGTLLIDSRPDEAAVYCERAVRVPGGKHQPKAWGNLGGYYGVTGRFAEALAAYERALRLEPANVQAIQGAALALAELGRDADAYRMLDYGLQLHPGEPVLDNMMRSMLAARRRPR